MLPFRVSSDSARSRLHPFLFAPLKKAVLASLRLSANTSFLIGSSHPNLSLSADPHWAMARDPAGALFIRDPAGALFINLNLPAHGPACQFPTHLPTSSCTQACRPAARSLRANHKLTVARSAHHSTCVPFHYWLSSRL